MKIQINNRIVDTEDIREITRIEESWCHCDGPYEAHTFQVKFYEGKGKTMDFEISKKQADYYPEDLLKFKGFNASLINTWSKNQLEIPKFILDY